MTTRRRVLLPMSLLMLPLWSSTAGASELHWRLEVNPEACGSVGSQIIDVVERVVNDADSGEAGNYWAFDRFARRIQVWPRSDGTFCALVSYYGRFDGQAGQTSPGATGTLSGEEDGAFQGGYRATIEGYFEPTREWNTMGYVGRTDYACDLSGDCPGRIDWVYQYFRPESVLTLEWWGWIYHGGEAGTWINSSDGNSGDILAP